MNTPKKTVLIILLIFAAMFNIWAQNFDYLRNKMVDEQLKTRDIKSEVVLKAMRTVPRHLFVADDIQKFAYTDRPLPIGLDQTISQPYIVAFMTQSLDPYPKMKVLEIGTGSGYQAAILAEIGCEVYTIEIFDDLAKNAKKVISKLKYKNVYIKSGNGYEGWQEHAPFDAIIVTAAPERIPEKLIEQLKEGGQMIIPVGQQHSVQSLILLTKIEGKIIEKELKSVKFVPMLEKK
ncbi:MAG: protein-L-isoaspartate(D-aspartate) O-methyltransferase [Marinilabiliaceae bacterium]|nr:protein-L-isoaspartate(D-aspartate) O-methyltransferase [Marinilabiliaceae bacterium]